MASLRFNAAIDPYLDAMIAVLNTTATSTQQSIANA